MIETALRCLRRAVAIVLTMTAPSLAIAAARTPPDTYADLPPAFESNDGQLPARYKFVGRTNQYFFGVHSGGLDIQPPGSRATIKLAFVGSNPRARVTAQNRLPGITSYFIGRDPRSWRKALPTFGKLRIEGVYPGIDLLLYGTHRELEFDWVVA